MDATKPEYEPPTITELGAVADVTSGSLIPGHHHHHHHHGGVFEYPTTTTTGVPVTQRIS